MSSIILSVACPFFIPTHRLDSWISQPRLSLGDAYDGFCQAAALSWHPSETAVREFCNVGYAASTCSHFPYDAAADAVRFTIVTVSAGAPSVHYVLEKNHWPVRHGVIGADSPELLQKQAQAATDSYLRKVSK